MNRLLALTALVVLGVVYASLYPFHFDVEPGGVRNALRALLDTWTESTSLGDRVANVIFYLPLGLLVSAACENLPRGVRIGLATAAGCLLSVAMETAQFYEAERDPSMSDVYANTAGALLGSLAPIFVIRGFRRWAAPRIQDKAALAVLACWLAARLVPFVPVIDLHKYWRAIHPLVVSPEWSVLGFYSALAWWILVSALCGAVWGAGRSRWILPPLMLAILLARIMIVDLTVTASEVTGYVASTLLWAGWLWKHPRRTHVTMLLFGAYFLLRGLEPFDFQAGGRKFVWIPFVSLIQADPEHATAVFLDKLALYGAMLWVLMRSGMRLSLATMAGCALVFAICWVHLYLPGRSSEITDTCMVALLGLAFDVFKGDDRRVAEHP